MPHVGSWNRTKTKKTIFVCVCWTCCFLHVVSNQCHMNENPHTMMSFLMAKFPLLLTGGLWYWRANYATLATCSEGLLKKRWGQMESWRKFTSWIPEFPHLIRKSRFFLGIIGILMSKLDEFCPCLRTQKTDSRFRSSHKMGKTCPGSSSSISPLLVGCWGKICSCIFVDGERDERKSIGFPPQKYAVIRMFS